MEFEVMKPEHIFIVKSAIGSFFNENNMRFSSKAVKRLNQSVKELLLKAIERAKQNGRKTILSQDCI